VKTLAEFLPFVKEQAAFHDKKAKQIKADPKRSKFHTSQAERLREMATAMADVQARLEKQASQPTPPTPTPPPQVPASATPDPSALLPNDLEGLPQELLDELSISETDKLGFAVLSIIEAEGGVTSFDKILIGLWRKTGKVHKRNTLQPKLYRMMEKKILFSVPNRKGVYSTSFRGEASLFEMDHVPTPTEEGASTPGRMTVVK
jgi:hypothetical protein